MLRGSEHSAIVRPHEAQIGVRFAGPDKLVHLIGNGEALAAPVVGFCGALSPARPNQIRLPQREPSCRVYAAWLLILP